jgi:predicted ATPase
VTSFNPQFTLSNPFDVRLRRHIHVPGLRGNPERTDKTTSISNEFPGTFEQYVASVINAWQATRDSRLGELGRALETLGLTWNVAAKQIDDAHVELRVGRLPHRSRGGTADMVSIADVGFRVSQILPVLVALLTAEPHQLVYLEEPEMHLHPCAQVALGQVLADAANRGMRVVAETHSAHLLLAVHSLVAEGSLAPQMVKLHWFKRRDDGVTEVTSADLDEAGAFGEWPEDFARIDFDVQRRYLDAAEQRWWNR